VKVGYTWEYWGGSALGTTTYGETEENHSGQLILVEFWTKWLQNINTRVVL